MDGQWWGVSTPGASCTRELQAPPELSIDRFNTGRDLGMLRRDRSGDLVIYGQ